MAYDNRSGIVNEKPVLDYKHRDFRRYRLRPEGFRLAEGKRYDHPMSELEIHVIPCSN